MSARDPVAVILAGLDRPVAPRPEFADGLLARLLDELGEARAPAGRPWRLTFRPRILPGAPPRLRLALIVIALLLLLAGIATATYFGIKTWISAGPRGVQYTNDFALTELARGVPYRRLALRPDGREAYSITVDPSHLADASLMRVSGLREGRVRSEVVLRFSDLRDPALWDPGTDLSGTIVPDVYAQSGQGATVDTNGDVVLVASVSRARKLQDFARTAPESTALLVRRADATVGKVLTLRELVSARLLDASAVSEPGRELAVTAVAPDRLFLYVQDRGDRLRFRRIYEVVDPNADGDWSDREITSLELPRFLGFDRPVTDPQAAWYVERLLAEPSVGGGDRSSSLLLAVSRFGMGQRRVYRVEDGNGDGDTLDAGELVLVFSGTPKGEFDGVMAPRVVIHGGKVEIRELLLAGFTTRTRVSRASQDGAVTDIARAFFHIEDVAADTEGAIYVLGIPPDGGTPSLFKLEPVAVGGAAAPSGPTVPTDEAASATPTPSTAPKPPVRIAVGQYVGRRVRWLLVGANGRRQGTLLSGSYPGTSLGPQSPRGVRFAYWSDREIPNEPFLYARADGQAPEKVTEDSVSVICWPSERWLLLGLGDGRPKPGPLIIRDVLTHRQRILLRHGAALGCTPDGRFALVRADVDYSKHLPGGGGTVELVDLRTGQRRHLLPAASTRSGYMDIGVSPDRSRVAYTLGAALDRYGNPRFYSAYVMDVATGKTVRLIRAKTHFVGAAYFNWSPTSDGLLLEISRPRPGRPCTLKEVDKNADACQFWDFALVDPERGTVEPIAAAMPHGPSDFWAPDGRSFAYKLTRKAITVVSVGGTARRFPGTGRYTLFGWSPDGRYIGLMRQSNSWIGGSASVREIAVLEVATGKVRTLVKTKADFLDARWWK